MARICKAFQAGGWTPDVRLVDAAHLRQALDSAVKLRPDAIVIGGGDGSIGTAAGVLSKAGIPLGVLPLGTFNHLAKDLGIPLRLEKAVASIMDGAIEAIDLGEVNGYAFINSSTVGAYVEFVRLRTPLRARARGKLGRWLAVFYSIANTIRGFPMLQISLEAGGRIIDRTTPFLFVGNNEFDRGLFISSGGRSGLRGGKLSIYISRCSERLCMSHFVSRVLTGRFSQFDYVDSLLAENLTVRTLAPNLMVSTDGEITRMHSPIRYRSVPGGLKVILPKKNGNRSSYFRSSFWVR